MGSAYSSWANCHLKTSLRYMYQRWHHASFYLTRIMKTLCKIKHRVQWYLLFDPIPVFQKNKNCIHNTQTTPLYQNSCLYPLKSYHSLTEKVEIQHLFIFQTCKKYSEICWSKYSNGLYSTAYLNINIKEVKNTHPS